MATSSHGITLETKNFLSISFFTFQNLDSIFNNLKKIDDPHSWWIFDLTDSENRG